MKQNIGDHHSVACSDLVGLPASGAAVPSADVQETLGGLGDVAADGVAVLEAVPADAPA